MQLSLKLVLGVIGNATAMALFLSPVPTFWKIYKKRSTQEFSGLPYVCTLFNCMLWVLYGMPFVKPNSLLIVSINGFGVALEIFYIAVFLVYATRKIKAQMARFISGVIVTYVGVIMITLLAFHSITSRQLLVGSLCVIVAIAMYTAPLSVMGLVIRTRSVEYMPFLLSLFNFINSAVWSAYSLVTKDIFVAIPNGLGCISGIVQLALYVIYMNAVPLTQLSEQKEVKPAGTLDRSMLESSVDEKQPPRKLLSPLRSPRPLSNYDGLAAQV